MLQNCIFQFLPGIHIKCSLREMKMRVVRGISLSIPLSPIQARARAGSPRPKQAPPPPSAPEVVSPSLSPKQHSSTHLLTWARVDWGLLALRPLAVGGSLMETLDTVYLLPVCQCIFAPPLPRRSHSTHCHWDIFVHVYNFHCYEVLRSVCTPEYPVSWK